MYKHSLAQEPKILVCKPKSLTKKAKDKLEEIGICVIEAANPEDIKLLKTVEFVPSNKMLHAAIKTIADNLSDSGSKSFLVKLEKLMAEQLTNPELLNE